MKYFSRKNKKIATGIIQKKTLNSGFTLVETLVAVSIFSVSIAAIISLVATGVGNTISAKNRIVANNLAQENIEYIRHLRNRYTGPGTTTDWNGLVDQISQCDGNICAMPDTAEENPNPEFSVCADQNNCDDFPVYYDENGYYYQTNLGVSSSTIQTTFLRYFNFSRNPNNGDEAKITVTVTWTERNNVQRNVTLSETISNWIPR